jgi:hypothetical protein
MITNRAIQSLSFAVMAFAASLAVAQGAASNDNDQDGSGCIDEGRWRGRGMGERAAPVYPFTVGSRSIE